MLLDRLDVTKEILYFIPNITSLCEMVVFSVKELLLFIPNITTSCEMLGVLDKWPFCMHETSV